MKVLQPKVDSLRERERDHSLIHDERGRVRLNMARALVLGHPDFEPDLEKLKGFYQNWVNHTEFSLFVKWTIKKVLKEQRILKEFYAVPASKRGNQIYYWRTQKRFRHLWQELESLGGSIFDPRANVKMSRLLFITLTWSCRHVSLRDSWETELSKQFNRWITGVRMKFGRVSVLRTWEAFHSGYPHVQVLLYFHEKEFTTFRDRKGKYRIYQAKDVQCAYPSSMGIQAMHSWKGAVNYATKYITKQLASHEYNDVESANKQQMTLALCWIFRKQSYAMSRDFVDLMKTLHNSKSEKIQLTLAGEPLKEIVQWVHLGVFGYQELGIPPDLKTQRIEPDSAFWARIEPFLRK